jgi:hypothetical protein
MGLPIQAVSTGIEIHRALQMFPTEEMKRDGTHSTTLMKR